MSREANHFSVAQKFLLGAFLHAGPYVARNMQNLSRIYFEISHTFRLDFTAMKFKSHANSFFPFDWHDSN